MFIFHRSVALTERLLLPLGLLLAFILTLLFSYPTSAQSTRVAQVHTTRYPTNTTLFKSNGPTIDRINIGFENNYQDGNWVPIQISLSNSGDNFDGTVSVNLPTTTFTTSGVTNQHSNYQENINLPSGAHKQITLDVPLNLGSQGSNAQITINLLDTTGRNVVSKNVSADSLNMNTALVGILSDTPNNFDRLNLALSSLLKSSGQTESLTPNTLPDQVAILKNFSVIVLDNFNTATLSTGQITALESWINQGGTLILAGGPEGSRTLNSLPANLLPVTINGISNLPADTDLLPVSSRPNDGQSANNTLKLPVPISTAQIKQGSTSILEAANTPLIVKGTRGQGAIYYLAYDPALEPLADWQNTEQLWSDLLTRAIGDRILMSGNTANVTNPQWQSSQDASMSSLLQTFFPNSYPSVWLILTLLLGYVLILGPVRLLVIRHFKRRDWNWRIVLATIVVFSALSYGLALHQKGTSIINSSISVVQLSQPDATGTVAHTTTYVGMFVPNQGDFDVHIPGSTLVQTGTANNNPYQGYNPQQGANTASTTFAESSAGTDVSLHGVNIWTTRTLMASNEQHLKGGIISHLQQQQNIVSGSVTNTLPYTLDDVYIAIANTYISLGTLPADSTRAVKLNLNSNSAIGNMNQMTIADQIANKQGLNINPGYSPYNTSNVTQNVAQRHALMLEALSGNYCDAGGCYRSNTAISSINGIATKSFANGTQSSNQDPLLLAGTPATLIGWSHDPITTSNTVTINGNSASGTQDTLIQAPLDVNVTGPVTLPAGLIDARIIHLQQDQPNNIQEPSPDNYTLTTGNVTIEYSIPAALKLRSSQLTFTSNANITKMVNPTMNLSSDINHLQAYLYNWQKGTWDTEEFSQYSLVIKDARPYIGPGNRVLLHLSNQDATLGTVIFDKPALTLQGTTES